MGPLWLTNHVQIEELGLVDDLVFTDKKEPGAKNRFVYYPDRLNRLPSDVPGITDLFPLWRSGILDGFMGLVKEPMQPKRSVALSDETVGSFLARRVDKRIANNLISAVFHGIYAGDIWQLSAKTLLSMAWHLEGRYGNALGGFMRVQNESTTGRNQAFVHPYDFEVARAVQQEIDISEELAVNMKNASVFSFKDGLQTLVRGLQNAMEKTGNIEIKLNSPVSSFKMAQGEEQKVEIIAGVGPSLLSPISACTPELTKPSPMPTKPLKTTTLSSPPSVTRSSPPMSPL